MGDILNFLRKKLHCYDFMQAGGSVELASRLIVTLLLCHSCMDCCLLLYVLNASYMQDGWYEKLYVSVCTHELICHVELMTSPYGKKSQK